MKAQRLMSGMVVTSVVAMAGCGVSEGDTYTLYRNSVITQDARMHVASFDTDEGGRYNNENCQHAMGLLQAQPDVQVRFWCEKGRYRK